jgi:hypothetical protein
LTSSSRLNWSTISNFSAADNSGFSLIWLHYYIFPLSMNYFLPESLRYYYSSQAATPKHEEASWGSFCWYVGRFPKSN